MSNLADVVYRRVQDAKKPVRRITYKDEYRATPSPTILVPLNYSLSGDPTVTQEMGMYFCVGCPVVRANVQKPEVSNG